MAVKKSNNVSNGRYSYGGGTVDFGNRLGWWDRANLPSSESDMSITITSKYAKRPDLLAYDLYGQSTLLWLILQYNNIIDVNTEFVEGTKLILPTKTRVMTELLNTRYSAISKT